jgi:hypothetical protein
VLAVRATTVSFLRNEYQKRVTSDEKKRKKSRVMFLAKKSKSEQVTSSATFVRVQHLQQNYTQFVTEV